VTQELYSVFQVAERLKLHVKTVRHFVREGKLKATRIGKQYRIARADLEAFTGHPVLPTERETARRYRYVEVSGIAQIDAISPEASGEVANSLSSFVYGRGKAEKPLRIETMYDQDIGRMKIILLGDPRNVSSALTFLSALLES
jgi:excisionase family DNA binding protein